MRPRPNPKRTPRAAMLLAGALALLVVLPLAASPLAHGQPEAPALSTVGIRFLVARQGDAPIADGAWLSERADVANRIYAPAGVSFRVMRADALEPGHEHIVTRQDRNVLGSQVAPDVINVFVVASLADVDVEGRALRGVHWRSRLAPSGHYVILSRICGPTVLAHELGHFYGNGHSLTPGNIMSYDRGGVEQPFFDVAQIRRIRSFARRFQRTRELVPVASPR